MSCTSDFNLAEAQGGGDYFHLFCHVGKKGGKKGGKKEEKKKKKTHKKTCIPVGEADADVKGC
jgi:hypothetical protein